MHTAKNLNCIIPFRRSRHRWNNIKFDLVGNMLYNLATAAKFRESWTNRTLLTDMELMDTVACLGLYAKRRNVSSWGSPLLRTSCTSYLGRYWAQDSSEYSTKLIITYSNSKKKIHNFWLWQCFTVNRKISNIFCHIRPNRYKFKLRVNIPCLSVYIVYSFLPIFISFFSESTSADFNSPRESYAGALRSDLGNMQITNITLPENYFLLCVHN
jgi:hypothetical protein